MQQRQYGDYTIGGIEYTSLSPADAQSLESRFSRFSSIPTFSLPGQPVTTSTEGETRRTTTSRPFPTPTSYSTTSITPAPETEPSTSTPTSRNSHFPSSTSSAPLSISSTFGSGGNGSDHDHGSGWDGMGGGAHIGVIMALIIGVVLIIGFSFWFCCGGRARWSKRAHHNQEAHPNTLPLYTVPGETTQVGVHRPVGGVDAPPIYAEVAPPEHQTVAGGLRDASEVRGIEDESAIVSDGKTPLSEIPFEDVVLERHVSESESSGSSSRGFEERHHGMGGDTTGHTNT